MAHWAEIDENNVVLRVTVGYNNDPDEGYQWLMDNLGGRWIQTSYNNNFRKQYAGIGFTYDELNDVFISPSPYPSWVLNTLFDWVSPIPMPTEVNWVWDEPNTSWKEVN